VTFSRPDPEVAAVFAAMADLIYGGPDVFSVYQSVADAAVRLVPGCDHACVTLLTGGRFRTTAATDDVARRIDELERELNDGPCVDAIIEEAYQHDPDLCDGSQWPELARRVILETPVRGMIGYRIVLNKRKVGALNIFSDTPNAMTVEAADAGAILAAFASVALIAAEEHRQAEELKRGLESNREIGKAMGLLMASHHINSDEAFDVLRRASSQLNRKLVDIAGELVRREQR
jgi:hypothetical protein